MRSLMETLVACITNRWAMTVRYPIRSHSGVRFGYPHVLHSTACRSRGEHRMYLEFYQVSGHTSQLGTLPGPRTLIAPCVEVVGIQFDTQFPPPLLNLAQYDVVLAHATESRWGR